MERQNDIRFTGRFEMENKSRVIVSVNYYDISSGHRNKIEKATEDFLNSVDEILVKE